MRALLFIAAIAAVLAGSAGRADAGVVKGRVVDGEGRPMAGVKITVENTVFHASYVFGRTGADGQYGVEVPGGGWKVHAQITRDFHGKSYFFDLAPDDPQPFTGTAGAVRNFTWRIAGPRPDPSGGFYGGQLTVMRDFFDPGLEVADLEVTLVPDGPLVDGSRGRTVTARPAEGRDQIDDVPVGRYTVSVRHRDKGPMQVRVRNRGEYAAQATVLFTSPYPESSRFGLEIEVKSP